MATKLTFIGAAPAPTTGADVVNAGPQTPTVADQNIANLRAAVDAKAALSGSAVQDFAAKTLTATTVNANNIGEITHSQGVVTTYAASGSTGVQIANNDNLNFGTGDFTLVWKGSLPDWTATVQTFLLSKYSTGFGFVFNTETNGGLRVGIGNGAGITYYYSVAMVSIDAAIHSVAVKCVKETATTAGEITFHIDGVQLGSPVVIPPGTPITLNNSVPLYVNGYSSVRAAATTQSAYAYNRALSAAEVLSLYRYGVAESDKWGSQSNLVTDGDFSLGGATWTKGAGVVVADQGAGDYEAVLTSVANAYAVYKDGIVTSYIKYRATFTITSITAGEVRIYVGGTQGISRTSAGTYTEELTAGVAGYITRVGIITVGTATCRIDDISIVKLGATLALEPEGIQPAPGQWLDSSSNKLHALQPATGSSLARKKENFEIRWINTWAGTSETQYIAGINQAIIPVNGYIESIVAVVTGTSVQNIIAGDGVDTDRWVALTSGLTAGTQTLAIANRVSDGTNRKMTAAPSAAATMSISWVIRGVIL